MDFDHYAIQHPDGRWLYHLPTSSEWGAPTLIGITADGQPMTRLRDDSPWWSTDHQAEQITATYQPRPVTTGYTLNDPDTESVRYPTHLTRDEFKERLAREDSDTLYSLYSSQQAEQEPVTKDFPGPFTVLEGREPPAPDEPQWISTMPHSLTQHPQYAHLFPGRIPNLRTHLHKVIQGMPRVRHCFDGYQGSRHLHVTIEVPFDQPQTRWQANTGRSGKRLKSGRTVPVTVTRSLNLPVPADVPGDTYAQALEAWEQQVAFWTSLVSEASVKACSACGGTGHVATGETRYDGRLTP